MALAVRFTSFSYIPTALLCFVLSVTYDTYVHIYISTEQAHIPCLLCAKITRIHVLVQPFYFRKVW